MMEHTEEEDLEGLTPEDGLEGTNAPDGPDGADDADAGDGAEEAEIIEGEGGVEGMERVIKVRGMYNDYFLDYASYVILERAVPHQRDGLKPVQRRILHSLDEMDDGRFHKVANVIGNTMKYHPHGDASIGDALVQIGQKDLLLDCQGNWGNIHTGDRAAAPRYIEVRLSKFAREVAFNPKTTHWLQSYDGRNREPETLPMKFPLLLAQGVEGIAVGLACKTLPHNFIELIDASIAALLNKPFVLYPDFPTGGMADVEHYNDGLRGGRVRVRAKIEKEDNKTLIVRELPYGVTTGTLIESILKANDRGKIKIRKVEDNTAENVEVVIHLAPQVSPDKTIDALYAFTDCEVSLSPNSTVILDDKPHFLGVSELLRISADATRELLRRELEIELGELQEKWHFASLEKIFIENRIYRDIEECETWEDILATIHAGLKPFIGHLLRPVTDDDVTRLTEIRIKRISRFDGYKADQYILGLEGDIDQVKHHLAHLTEYAVEWFRMLKKKYGEGRERKTQLRAFESIDRAEVAVANARLYADYAEGFVGIGLKRGEGELIGDCSDLDDVVVIRQDGILQVSKVTAKAFFGKNLLYVGVWKRGDERSVFNCIYLDGETGRSFAKRFNVTSITRDREYPITKGTPKSRVLYLSANPNGEAEVVTVHLRPSPRLKKLRLDLDFAELAVRGRSSAGNLVTKFPIRKVELSEAGVSTLGARKVWYDETVRRLNADGRGRFLGDFRADDRILVLLSSGEYLFTGFDLSTHFDDRMVHLEKFMPDRVVSVAYFEGEKGDWYAKRFLPEPTQKPFRFIGEHEQSRLGVVSMAFHPLVRLRYNRRFKETRDREDEVIDLSSFIAVKGVRALGNKLSPLPLTEVTLDPVDEALEAEAHERAMSAAAAPIVATGMEDATEADTERTTGESSATELGEKTSIPLPTPEFSIPARDVSPPSAPPELPGQRDLTSSPFKKRKSGAPPEQPTLF